MMSNLKGALIDVGGIRLYGVTLKLEDVPWNFYKKNRGFRMKVRITAAT